MYLNEKEKVFLSKGGRIWAIRQNANEKWELVKLHKDGEYIPPESEHNTRENAEKSVCILANMELSENLVAVHHEITRPADWPEDYLAP
jgi:hypothetical protein